MATIAPSVLARYVDDIAFVAGAQPATTPEEFAAQLETAAHRLSLAGINGAEDLATAATYLTDAMASTGKERATLTTWAVRYLASTDDMVDEYRLMV